MITQSEVTAIVFDIIRSTSGYNPKIIMAEIKNALPEGTTDALIVEALKYLMVKADE